jgi:60 kDa SS-A/Ro ribonucleoprotein
MSRYSTTVPKVVAPNTYNKAGGEAYKASDKLALASLLLTSFLQDNYYRSGNLAEQELIALVHRIPDKMWVAKAAIMARDWGMRSVTHVVMAELCHDVKGEEWTRLAIARAIQRPDDATEILAYWLNKYGRKGIPNAMKRGIADGLAKFNDYQIAKYKGEGHTLKMVDVVNLVHPKSAVFGKLINGTLETPYTWETKLSSGRDKTEVWTELVESGKLGYFALLRNLRNLEQNISDATLTKAYAQLTDEKAIKNSKVLPFRYDTAIEQVSNPKTKAAISKAVDCSGSMGGRPAQIASMFAAVMFKATGADVILFENDAKYISLNPADSITTLAKQMKFAAGRTNFNSIFTRANKKYDRIIILSDMQAWMADGYYSNTPTQALKDYKTKYIANPDVWSFDLQGYGTLQFPENKVYTLAGFSEKVFDIIPLIEDGGKDALLKVIDQVTFA